MSLDVYLYDANGQEISLESLKLQTSLNVTHNLTSIADALGIYACLWHPERLENFEEGVIPSQDILPFLYKAFYKVTIDGDKYLDLLPKNGWGTLKSLADFIVDYIKAVEAFPNAFIHTST